MRARVALLAYLAAIVLATTVHEIGLLALGLLLVLALAGRGWLRVLRRACLAILLFNPLRNRLQRLVDRFFDRDRVAYRVAVREISEAMVSMLSLSGMGPAASFCLSVFPSQ